MNIAFFSFLGIVVGAALQYLFTRHLDNQNFMKELRTAAYKDYLNGVFKQSGIFQPKGKVELNA